MKRKIILFTGGRQDYYLLKPLMTELLKRGLAEVGFLVGETHFSKLYGNTVKQIKLDNMPIWGKVSSNIKGDKPLDIVKKISNTSIQVSKILSKIKPACIVLLGDRYELLAAAQASMLNNIPIAHLHGGESTEGVIDEVIRHAITKMAHLHFVSTKKYRNRIIQMGENSKNVFNYGALGVDNVKSIKTLSKMHIFNFLNINAKNQTFIITYHPLTLDNKKSNMHLNNLLKVLEDFKKTNLVFTYPNSDTYGLEIIKIIKKYIKKDPINRKFLKNLGVKNYLSLMKYSDLVIGNSSSGIIEAPSLGVPTINIGPRQEGRVKAKSVIQVDGTTKSIIKGIHLGLKKEFVKKAKLKENPYGKGQSARKIASALLKKNYEKIIFKKFYDLSL